MKKLAILLCFIPAIVFAQDYGRSGSRPLFSVTGLVIDSLSNEPLSFAALSFISPQDDQLITGGICNDEGRFIIEEVPVGAYKLLVEYMGYVPKIIPEVKVKPNKNVNKTGGPYSATNSVIDLGEFYMNKSIDQLDEIELVEEKPFVVQGIDRKIFNVDQDLTSSGSTAIELMEKLPSVEVDIDGNLSLRGSTQVRLYVDGKPSMLSSSDLLETMPSSMIESVELITNPSAKYSPEGMAGIINIVLKKNNEAGFNGNTSLTVGYPSRNNFTGLLNRRSDKLNLFASYSIMDRIGGFDSESEKHTYFSEDTFDLYLDKWGVSNRKSHTFKGGIDYTPNESTSFSLQGNYSPSERLNIDTINYDETSVGVNSEYYRLADSESDQSNWDIDLSAKKDWESGLHLDFITSKSQNTNDKFDLFQETDSVNLNELLSDTYPIYEQISSASKNDQFESKFDFSFGDEDQGNWEWGFGVRNRKMDQDQFIDSTYLEIYFTDSDSILDNSGLENRFVFEDIVYSAYLTYGKAFGLWSVQAGLRSEQVGTESSLKTPIDSTYNTDYFKLYPSLHLNYKMDESSSIMASYSRRVNRPGFNALNPFPQYSDPYNLRMGNPFLRPEFINSFELGYQKFAKGTTFTSSIYAKDVNDLQRRFVEVDSNNVTTVTRRNLNGSLDLGFEFMISKQVNKAFNFMLSTNVFHSKIDASNLTSDFDESTFGMRSSFNIGWKKNDHKVQASGWIRPGGQIGQGRMYTMFSTDLAYSRPLFSKQGKLTLKISDVFNTRRFGIDTYGRNFDQSFVYNRISRFFTINISCNFGEQENNRKQRRGNYGGYDSGGMDNGFF
jgi:iron complex outermembrane recepter protein